MTDQGGSLRGTALDIFKNNDVDRLFAVGESLWSRRVFDYYLTQQQLVVLERIFNGSGGVEGAKTRFVRFLKGEVFLRFVENTAVTVGDAGATATTASSGEHDTSKNNNNHSQNNNGGGANNGKYNGGSQQQQKSEDDIVETSVQSGVEPARSLALKVRYILWDKAIDYYFDQDGTEQEYEIFEQYEQENEPEQESQATVDTVLRKVTEDEDYDDDEDEDGDDDQMKDGDKNTDQSSTTTDAGSSVEADQFDSNGHLILEVPIVTSESSSVDNKTLIENFSKIYHNYENDKETLIKRRKLEENDKLLENDNMSSTAELISMNLGAANLSLKHLLRSIDDNKDKLQFQDNELRQLIMDVRKNRSKWASDDKIGQEELYEACEKVVMELRSYTEHSTAFLNRVSKRDAPNYYQIIKKPMDLNTILKKLKSFHYKSKSEFVDDVMLIWKNCFTYNADPRHFLRVHAIAMQKKTLQLVPLIPDITVRERVEVETEAGTEEASTPGPSGKTTSKKGKKRTRNGEVKEESATATPVPPPSATTSVVTIEGSAPPVANGSLNGVGAVDQSMVSTPTAVNNTGVGESTEMDDEDNGETNEYLNTGDNDKDDMETQMWKNLTSKARSDYCIKRSDLFKDNNELNIESEAILRDPKKMKNFVSFLKHYNETKKHVFNVSKNAEEDPYLIEYDITGGLPSIGYRGLDEEEVEEQESKLVDKVLAEGLKPSEFVAQPGGLNQVVNDNITEMQEIRRICFKISLIRQMQQQQFLHHSQMKPPEIEKIDDTIDIDPVSRLATREKMNKDLVYSVMRKRVSKVAMLSGFESTELSAVDTLTQIAGDYMDNLVRTIKTHLETPSANREQKKKSILSLSLLQNGITRPEELHTYVTENVLSQRDKLKELKLRLVNFLKTLLRPALEMNEKNFDDNSEQFMNGDFSNEIGDDFFGFKELGLDKEFSMLGNALPLHLLQSKLSEANTVEEGKKTHREDFEKAPEVKLKESDIEKHVRLFQPFLRTMLEKTKTFHCKQFKSKKESQDYLATIPDMEIMEDDDFPTKKPRAKLPPNGKMPNVSKRKVTTNTFFLPQEDLVSASEDNSLSLSSLGSAQSGLEVGTGVSTSGTSVKLEDDVAGSNGLS